MKINQTPHIQSVLTRHLSMSALFIAAFTQSALAAPQASLTLSCGSAGLCNATQTEWSLEKTGVVDGSKVTWTIQATRGAESHAFLTFNGSLRVTNTGSADATIGNIVLNLQKKSGNKFVTLSSDIANATLGDAATSANICSGASSEGRSFFSENGGSGSLNFTDVSNNTVFSLIPQQVIAPGATVDLNYVGTFDATVLGVNAGDSIRLEAIVSFGNSGGRGDSGASCSNVDISGDGTLDPSEAKVRSVPCRTTITVPALERSNSSVILSDKESNISTTGSVNFSNYSTTIGSGTGYELLTGSAARTLSVNFTELPSGGTMTNCAQLTSYPTPSCNAPLAIEKCNTQVLDDVGFEQGDYCTYTQGGWGAKPAGGNPGTIITHSFPTVYPSGVEVGVSGTSGYSMKFSSALSITNYLPAGGPGAALNADLINPLSSSSGVFGGQVLALQLNVDLNRAGIINGTKGSIASLVLLNTGTPLDGKSVDEILTIANQLLGGVTLSNGLTIPVVLEVITKLNEAFDNCTPTSWSQTHIN